MNFLLEYQSDDYLHAMAAYFADQRPPSLPVTSQPQVRLFWLLVKRWCPEAIRRAAFRRALPAMVPS